MGAAIASIFLLIGNVAPVDAASMSGTAQAHQFKVVSKSVTDNSVTLDYKIDNSVFSECVVKVQDTQKQKRVALVNSCSNGDGSVTISGLEAGTAYKARVGLYSVSVQQTINFDGQFYTFTTSGQKQTVKIVEDPKISVPQSASQHMRLAFTHGSLNIDGTDIAVDRSEVTLKNTKLGNTYTYTFDYNGKDSDFYNAFHTKTGMTQWYDVEVTMKTFYKNGVESGTIKTTVPRDFFQLSMTNANVHTTKTTITTMESIPTTYQTYKVRVCYDSGTSNGADYGQGFEKTVFTFKDPNNKHLGNVEFPNEGKDICFNHKMGKDAGNKIFYATVLEDGTKSAVEVIYLSWK